MAAVPAAAQRSGATAPTSAPAAVPAAIPLSVDAVRAPVRLPLAGGEGPEVLRAQILLDAAGFAPGAVDGKWAENTLFALRTFRLANGLARGDSLDEATWERLVAAAGGRDPIADYTLTAADVRGPFRRLPKSIYGKARLDCLCHESLVEALAERFHTTPRVLRELNPEVDFARAAAGSAVRVPNVAARTLREPLARLEVHRGEGSLRGLDARGETLFWLPASVGSEAEPSPSGRLRVVSVERNPRYHFNPRVLGDVPDSQPDAMLAPGPNSPVGVLWVQLSRAHVGIHGTPDPESVGYAQSHGCVRLTNWDAAWLAGLLRPGMEVLFR